jgi:tRNA (guanine37-N1)-methyltransferase
VRFSVVSLFPEYFKSPLEASLIGKAASGGLLSFDFVNPREFGEGNYRAVDDKPYGGGAGMVMMAPVLERSLERAIGGNVDALISEVAAYRSSQGSLSPDKPLVVYLSPQGRKLDAATARRLAGHQHVVLICGHYEGIDERAIEALVHDEVSIGDYILTGGEPAACVLIDAVARFVPGVVGEGASVEGDTFESAPELAPGGLKYPVYTRPPIWRGKQIPEVLTSGHHGEIAKWRRAQSEARTKARRPDLISKK